MYRCLPSEARHTTIFSSMTIWDKGGVNINTGEAGENIDCPVCVVLLYFQYWCPAGSGGEEGAGWGFLFTIRSSFLVTFVLSLVVFFVWMINASSDPPWNSYTMDS